MGYSKNQLEERLPLLNNQRLPSRLAHLPNPIRNEISFHLRLHEGIFRDCFEFSINPLQFSKEIPIDPSKRPFEMGGASMKFVSRLKVAFDEGKGPSMGCWQMIPGSNVSRTLAGTGVDWVLVDCERGNMDGELCRGSSVITALVKTLSLLLVELPPATVSDMFNSW
jgi:hypothetical protein